MQLDENEEHLLRSVALQNAKAVLLARERAERELLHANQRITNILESITDGFVAFDKDWRVVFLNRRGEEILRPLNKSQSNMLGESHWKAFPDTIGTPLEEHYRRAMREQVTVHFETFYAPLHAWFDIRAYPSPDGLSVYFQDITERKRAAEELRQQQQWFAVTLASIGDAVITTDTEGKVTFLNPVAEAITGWKTKEAAGQPLDNVFRIINERNREPAISPVSKVLQEGKTIALANHTALVARDGRETSIEDSAAPIRDTAGNISGVVMVFHDVTARRRADQVVRDSEKRFAALVTASAQTVWVADGTGEFAEYSPSWAALTGQSFEEMQAWGRLRVIHADDRERLLAQWKQAIANKTAIDTEYQMRCVSGGWRWTAMRAVPLLAEDGSIASWVGMNTDITERRHAEERLRASENRKSAILSGALDAIITMDHEGNVADFNPAAERIFGYTGADAVGKPLAELIIPERFRQRHYDGLKRYLATREGPVLNKRIELPGLRADGSEFPTELSISRITGIEPPMFTATLRDITERKRTEETLRENEERLRATFNQAAVGIAVAALDGHFVEVNQKFAEIMGYSAGELRELTVADVTHPKDLATTRDNMRRLLKGEIPHYATEKRFIRKNRSEVWCLTTVTVVKDATGKTLRYIGVIEDISARKQAEESVRRSEEELRALADSIPQLAWIAEPDGHIFWYNRKWYEYTGTTLKDMEGWGWQSVHDPKMLPLVLERWKDSINTGHPFEMEFPLRGADGMFRWFLTRVNPVRDSEGRVVRWFGTNTNVDDVRNAREALRDETRILEVLNDTGRAIASKIDLQDVVQTVTDAGTKLCGAQFGAFFYNVINERGESFMLYTLSGAPREAFEKFGMPRNTPVFDPTFSGQGVVRSDDITQDPRYGRMGPHFGMPKGHLRVRSYLAVPVVSRSGEVIGGLFFGHSERGVFTERSERLVVGVAAQAVIAIDNARLYDAAQREIAERKKAEEALAQRVRLTALRAEVSAELARSDDLRIVMKRCTNALVKHVDAVFARIWTVNAAEDILELQASSGLYTHLDGPHGRVKIGEFKIGRIAQSREPHLTNEVQNDPTISDPEWARREGMVAFAGYPLIVANRVVGVIALFARQPFTEELLKELSLMADGLAQWIQRKQAEQALHEAREKLSRHAEDLENQVTERTATLRETIGELEAFSYSISHDMRAPLRAMQGFAHILAEEHGPQLDAQGQEYIRRITTAAERLDRLIQDVLTYSRIAGKDLPLVQIDVEKLVQDILLSYPAFQPPAAEIHVEGKFPRVLGIDAVLTQCISNLLGNAVKFVAPGVAPRVRVWAEPVQNGEKVRIFFKDNGVGIEKDAYEHIFGMFQRLSRSYEGTGIGLAIVKKGAERMSGSVGLKSEPGQGSTFWLELKRGR